MSSPSESKLQKQLLQKLDASEAQAPEDEADEQDSLGREFVERAESTLEPDLEDLAPSDETINNRISNFESLLRKVLRPVRQLVTPSMISIVVNMVFCMTRPGIPEGHKRITWICVSG